jgi:hypothetical protein
MTLWTSLGHGIRYIYIYTNRTRVLVLGSQALWFFARLVGTPEPLHGADNGTFTTQGATIVAPFTSYHTPWDDASV